MNRKKLILRLSLIGGIVALAIGGTIAYFQDRETSAGNKFTAGKFNLKVGSQCTYNGDVKEDCNWLTPKDLTNELFFNFADIKPGDYGENTLSLKLDNNDAWMCAEVANLVSDDNGCEKPESDIDHTCGPGEGELKENILFTVWKDTDCDNQFDDAIPGIPATPGQCASGVPGDPCFMYSASQQYCLGMGNDAIGTCYWIPGQPSTPATPAETVLVSNQPAQGGFWPIADSTTGTGALKGGQTSCLGVSWKVPIETSNIIQTDSLVGDVIFSAVQSRHMSNFKCGDLYTEICGDGKDNDYDGQIDEGCITCGNGIIEGNETCDDANTHPDDGCSASCNIEPGWQCMGSPSVCAIQEICDGIDNDGNGLVDEGFPDTDGDSIADCTDADDDNDGVPDPSDINPLNPQICRDNDSDMCDDCSMNPTSSSSPTTPPWPAYTPSTSNDGIDTDADGICDLGDSDSWISPTSFFDNESASGFWNMEEAAYDNDPGTTAFNYVSYPPTWGPFLELNLASPVTSHKLRYWMPSVLVPTHYINQVDIDVYKNSVWQDLYQGAIAPTDAWVEQTYSSGLVSKARVRFYNSAPINTYSRGFNELQIWGH